MKLILALCFVWIAPLICLFLRNEARFKKNIAVGVTLPQEGREDAQVQSRLRRYRAQQLWVYIALLLLMLPCLAAGSAELSVTLLCTWLLVCVLAPYIPYVLCNRDLKALKRARGWGPSEAATVRVDTQAIPTSKWLSPACFLIPLPLLWGRELWAVYGIDAACIVLFWFCYRYLYRNKAEQVDGDLLLTRALTQVRRHNWGLIWLLCAALLAVLNLVMPLTYRHPLAMMLGILAVTVALVLAALGIELRTRTVQERLTASSATGAVRACLDPTCPPFLYLVTEDGTGYLFGTRDAALTASVYESLTAVNAEAFQ